MASAAAGKPNTVTGRNGMRLKQESDHAEAQRWVDAYSPCERERLDIHHLRLQKSAKETHYNNRSNRTGQLSN